MFFLYVGASHRQDALTLALWSLITVRGRGRYRIRMFMTPGPDPMGESQASALHWLLSSECECGLLFGNYVLSVV
jgi:hypothetical protein